MKTSTLAIMAGWITLLAADAQVDIPPPPGTKLKPRQVGGLGGGGVEVNPSERPESPVKYITYLTLSVSRIWQSNDGKTLEGKLIAFEDLVVEAPKGQEAPPAPEAPKHPTVVRNGKIRVLIDRKAVEIPLARLSHGDQEFVEGVRKANERKTPPTP
jgi:hypothetical protein